MRNSELRDLSIRYASGKITTTEYRAARKHILDKLTQKRFPESGRVESVHVARKSILFWFLGIVVSLALVIFALFMPGESPHEKENQPHTEDSDSSKNYADWRKQETEKSNFDNFLEKPGEKNPPPILKNNKIKVTKNKTVHPPTAAGDIKNNVSKRSGEAILSGLPCQENWLAMQGSNSVMLQLCASVSKQNISTYLEDNASLNLNATQFDDQTSSWIIYGYFDNQVQAARYADTLIKELQEYVRTGGVQSKILSPNEAN